MAAARARARDLLQQIDRQRSVLRHSEDVYRSLFDNAGTAAITIGTINETSPGVFAVQVTPSTSQGTKSA